MFPNNTKVLVADDMKTMRMVVKKNLAALGFTDITEAVDGQVAWAQVEAAVSSHKPFMLIVSDWTMPNMTGLEFLKKVRSHPVVGKTPFLMVTAEADAALVKEALAAGVSNYVTKPFSAETFKEKLETIWKNLQRKSS